MTDALPDTRGDAQGWSPDSWTRRPAQQQVEYADQAALARVVQVVPSGEVSQ